MKLIMSRWTSLGKCSVPSSAILTSWTTSTLVQRRAQLKRWPLLEARWSLNSTNCSNIGLQRHLLCTIVVPSTSRFRSAAPLISGTSDTTWSLILLRLNGLYHCSLQGVTTSTSTWSRTQTGLLMRRKDNAAMPKATSTTSSHFEVNTLHIYKLTIMLKH